MYLSYNMPTGKNGISTGKFHLKRLSLQGGKVYKKFKLFHFLIFSF